MKILTLSSRWLNAIVLVLLAAALIPIGVSAKAVPALDARLGGTNTSFQAAFGAPNKDKSSTGIEVYDVSGFGLVAAAFLNSNANEVTIAADRLAHTPLTAADAADWTVTNATSFADALLPTDATYGTPKKTNASIELSGHSATLEGAFTKANLTKLNVAGVPGDFLVTYNLDTSGNVYSVDMSVGSGSSAVTPAATVKASATAKASATKASSSSSNSTKANSTNSSGTAVHCSSFQTQAEAQAYFDGQGGVSNPAVAGLDGDKDGKACEGLP